MDRGAWCPWGHKESDTTERLHYIGKGKRGNTMLVVCLLIYVHVNKMDLYISLSLFVFQVILVFVLSIGSLIIYFINSTE